MDEVLVLTGASSGLGLAAARALARSPSCPGTVFLLSENEVANERAAAALSDLNGAISWRPVLVDLGELDEVVGTADRITAGSPAGRISALVANAGVYPSRRPRRNRRGVEATFAINVLGHVALLQRLLPALSSDARLVLVSSASARDADLASGAAWVEAGATDLAAVYRNGWTCHRQYAFTKACLLAYAAELRRRTAGDRPGRLPSGVRLTTYDPGAAAGSTILAGAPALARAAMSSPPVLRMLGIPTTTIDVAGEALAAVLLQPGEPAEPHLDGVPHFQLYRRTPLPRALLDPAVGRALFDAVHRLVPGPPDPAHPATPSKDS